jgi:hypothetical protein
VTSADASAVVKEQKMLSNGRKWTGRFSVFRATPNTPKISSASNAPDWSLFPKGEPQNADVGISVVRGGPAPKVAGTVKQKTQRTFGCLKKTFIAN